MRGERRWSAARIDRTMSASAGIVIIGRSGQLVGEPEGSVAGREVLRKLIADGATVRYHGDFDWPGIQITSRAYAGGGEMWRMGKVDYVSAVAQAGERVALEGKPLPTRGTFVSARR